MIALIYSLLKVKEIISLRTSETFGVNSESFKTTQLPAAIAPIKGSKTR